MDKFAGLRFVNAAELAEISGRGGRVVVAFVATWNRRCQSFAADYLKFAATRDVGVAVVCVDVDECTALTAAFDVCAIPTILVLRDGSEEVREVGLNLAAVGAHLKVES